MAGFQDCYGNEALKEHFQNAIIHGSISHAYILTGEEGSGRMTLAKAVAETLLCTGKGDRPCKTCHSCVQFESGNHPDVIYVGHEKPASIGVGDIREQLVEDITVRPYESQYKVYIVADAEKMTVQAQNALLKTIEEPPEYGIIFLLTTNAEAFLPTILSRCIQMKMMPLSDAFICNYLKDHLKTAAETAAVCAAFARGNLGKAIELASSEDFGTLYQKVLILLKKEKAMRTDELLEFIKTVKPEKGKNSELPQVLDLFELWFRDVLLFKATGDMNQLIFKNEYRAIRERADTSSFMGLQTISDGIINARKRLQANVNPDIVMELLLLNIKEN